MVNEIAGTSIEPLYRDGRKGEIENSLLDLSRIQLELNFTNSILLKSGLQKITT